jgi:hypothetical protein
MDASLKKNYAKRTLKIKDPLPASVQVRRGLIGYFSAQVSKKTP